MSSNELIEQQITKEQAEMWVSEVKRGIDNVRYYLLKIRDTKAWEVMGYSSFEDLGMSEFGFSSRHIRRLATAAEIQLDLDLGPIGPKMPETHLRPLARITKEERKIIYETAKAEAEAENRELTEKLIKEAADDREKSEQTIEEWRQQYFDERNGKRDLEEENRRIKESKKETIYIDDSEKALAQYKEETEGKLRTLLEESRIAKDELHRVETEKFNAINEGVNKKLENYDLQIENLQKQETALRNSIDILSDKEARLDDLVTAREKHSKAISGCKSALETVFIKAGVIFDGDIQTIHSDDAASWRKLKENIYAFGDEIEAKISALAVDD